MKTVSSYFQGRKLFPNLTSSNAAFPSQFDTNRTLADGQWNVKWALLLDSQCHLLIQRCVRDISTSLLHALYTWRWSTYGKAAATSKISRFFVACTSCTHIIFLGNTFFIVIKWRQEGHTPGVVRGNQRIFSSRGISAGNGQGSFHYEVGIEVCAIYCKKGGSHLCPVFIISLLLSCAVMNHLGEYLKSWFI